MEINKNLPVSTAELIELASVREDDEGNFSITKHRKLISLLQQPISPLCKSHLPVYFVLYPLQLNSSSSHDFFLKNPLNLIFSPFLFCSKKTITQKKINPFFFVGDLLSPNNLL